MNIDLKAPVQSTKSISIEASPGIIWDLMTQVNQWPNHFSHVATACMEGNFVPGKAFTWKSGGVKITSTIWRAKKQALIVWTGNAIGSHAVHVWRITPHGKECLVETSESMTGWLVTMMPRFMQKMLDKTLEGWLEALKKAAEIAV